MNEWYVSTVARMYVCLETRWNVMVKRAVNNRAIVVGVEAKKQNEKQNRKRDINQDRNRMQDGGN